MIPTRVVTACSLDSNYSNRWNNKFIPHRRSMSKNERYYQSQKLNKNQSASFSSVPKPVAYDELKDNFPILIKPKPLTLYKNGSVDSEALQKDIDYAVLLLESRNEKDLLYENNQKNYHSKFSDEFQFKIGQTKWNYNKIKKRSEYEIKEIKNEKNERGNISNRLINKCNIRLLSTNDASFNHNHKDINAKKTMHKVQNINHSGYNVPNLIISNSNSLESFITIDEISGIKDAWIQKSQKELFPEKTVNPINNSSIHLNQPKIQQFKKREDILREYMDVYMHWRTLNAIEEHHYLTKEIFRDKKFLKIRSATPKQRLDQFQNIIKNRKEYSAKSVSSYSRNLYQNSSTTNTAVESDSDNVDVSNIANNLVNTDKESIVEQKIDKNVEWIGKQFEGDQDAKSDTYSEIDWLECEDIY